MLKIALRMLTDDRAKFFGLVFGVAFSTMLMAQQLTIYVNLLDRGAARVHNTPGPDVWVMHQHSETAAVIKPIPSIALERVRSVAGVAWATPLLMSSGLLEQDNGRISLVDIVGIDERSLTGLPTTLLLGDPTDLSAPDAVFMDEIGAAKLFPANQAVLGQFLRINGRRAVVRGVVDAMPPFTSGTLIYTTYSNAIAYADAPRDRTHFIVAGASAGVDHAELAHRIALKTQLRTRTTDQFVDDNVRFVTENSGVAINFGITVSLGFIIGAAVVGLTFNLFIRDNISQFAALKAIGIGKKKMRSMVLAQAVFVGVTGYGIGLLLAVLFVVIGTQVSIQFKGFYIPWQVPLMTAGAVLVMLAGTAAHSVRTLSRTEPAMIVQ